MYKIYECKISSTSSFDCLSAKAPENADCTWETVRICIADSINNFISYHVIKMLHLFCLHTREFSFSFAYELIFFGSFQSVIKHEEYCRGSQTHREVRTTCLTSTVTTCTDWIIRWDLTSGTTPARAGTVVPENGRSGSTTSA